MRTVVGPDRQRPEHPPGRPAAAKRRCRAGAERHRQRARGQRVRAPGQTAGRPPDLHHRPCQPGPRGGLAAARADLGTGTAGQSHGAFHALPSDCHGHLAAKRAAGAQTYGGHRDQPRCAGRDAMKSKAYCACHS